MQEIDAAITSFEAFGLTALNVETISASLLEMSSQNAAKALTKINAACGPEIAEDILRELDESGTDEDWLFDVNTQLSF